MNRLLFLDYFKGISMIGVLLIHTQLYNSFDTDSNKVIMEFLHSIFSFAVAFFIFISGYVLSNTNLKVNIGRYLLPYLLWSIIFYILYCVYGSYSECSIVDFMLRLISFSTSGQYYFLLILFISLYTYQYFINICEKKLLIIFVLSLISTIMSQYMIFNNEDILLYKRSISYLNYINWVFYFLMGLNFKLLYNSIINKMSIHTLFFLTIFLVCLDYIDYIGVYKSGYDYFTWQSFLYNISIILFFMKINDYYFFNKKSIITSIGKFSFPIFLIHNLSFYFLKLSSVFLFDNIFIYIMLSIFYAVGITLIVVYLSEKVLKKYSVYLFGKIYFKGKY